MILPKNVNNIIDTLYSNGYEAFVVGGCVRDSILGKNPNDFDVTTNAKPLKVKEIFEKVGCKVIDTGLQHGTVTIVIEKENFEVTTYRIEGEYLDNRRPSEVFFTNELKEDLKRRDFTINALAYNNKFGTIDYFSGKEDLQNKIIRAIGEKEKRFEEDGLRMLRAVRFEAQLGFEIEKETLEAIKVNSILLKNISAERIRDEFIKILISSSPSKGIRRLLDLNLLQYIIPELLETVNFDQRSRYHDKDVFNHTMMVLDNVENNLEIRLAALLHDIAKPKTFTMDKKGGHFYFHEVEGEKMAKDILKKLRFDNSSIEKVSLLIRNHMRVPGITSKAKLKKYIVDIGEDNLNALFNLMRADRISSHPTYAKYEDIDELNRACNSILEHNEPMRIKDLNINGNDLIEIGVEKGKKVGEILNLLLQDVLENPKLNEREYLMEKSLKLIKC